MTYWMYDKLTKEPPIPSQIIEAINSHNLAVFIGSGVSQVIGCKGWGDLAQHLAEKCYALGKNRNGRYVNFKQKQTLIEDSDYKKTISICYHILEENGRKDAFYQKLEKCFKAKPKLLKSKNIYEEMIGLHAVFLTTNADRHFDTYFEPSRIAYRDQDFNRSTIERDKLYHIHGSILDPASLVFTLQRYMERYQDFGFRGFLDEIFKNYTVLFVGYGMSEFELLDFLMTKFGSTKRKELSRFMLKYYFKGEENILKLDQYYYGEMGIVVVGYEIDDTGYDQLYAVIRHWKEQIDQTSTYLYDSFSEIDEAVDNP